MGLRRHYVATGYIYDQETARFLLIQHKKLGKWLAPGGHLLEGEEPHAGALREVLEEIGCEGRIVDLLDVPQVGVPAIPQLPAPFCILAETIPAGPREDEHVHIDFIYVVEIAPAAVLSLSAAEVVHARWIAAEEIDGLETFENVKQVCRAIHNAARARL
jgi:8-oxo-dGTP pyrophosphatase MutT (NUDIX family)